MKVSKNGDEKLIKDSVVELPKRVGKKIALSGVSYHDSLFGESKEDLALSACNLKRKKFLNLN